MNFEDEPYVRLYTTDTATWELLGWEGQTVLMHMLRGKFDRAGVFSCGRHEPSRAVTAVTRLPASLVETGLAALLREEVWLVNNGQLVWPNYHYAQTCPRTDRLRQAESRKNRAQAALPSVTQKTKPLSQNVTGSHEPSQASQSVTLSCTDLSLADQNKEDLVELELDISLPDLESFSPDPAKPKPKTPSPHHAEAVQVFEAWKTATGHQQAVMDPKRLNRLKARLREGHTVDQLLAVCRNWRNDPWLAGSSGKTYDGIETLFRDAEQVERLAALTAPVKAIAPVTSRFAPPVSPNVDFETKQRLASSRRVQAMMEGKF